MEAPQYSDFTRNYQNKLVILFIIYFLIHKDEGNCIVYHIINVSDCRFC